MSFHKLEKYVSNPTQLQGLKYKQPILVSDSKGFTLKNNYHGKFPVECWCQPGATTKLLVDQIETHIEPALRYHKTLCSICGQVPVILHKSQVNLSV